ncbi:MAG: hypothetical protein HHAS10_01530 [Candidatus Altimarinota bacterium]
MTKLADFEINVPPEVKKMKFNSKKDIYENLFNLDIDFKN